MTLRITNTTWLNLLFLVLASISIYWTIVEDLYSLRHAVIDIETTMVLLASIFYKEESENDEGSTPA